MNAARPWRLGAGGARQAPAGSGGRSTVAVSSELPQAATVLLAAGAGGGARGEEGVSTNHG